MEQSGEIGTLNNEEGTTDKKWIKMERYLDIRVTKF